MLQDVDKFKAHKLDDSDQINAVLTLSTAWIVVKNDFAVALHDKVQRDSAVRLMVLD